MQLIAGRSTSCVSPFTLFLHGCIVVLDAFLALGFFHFHFDWHRNFFTFSVRIELFAFCPVFNRAFGRPIFPALTFVTPITSSFSLLQHIFKFIWNILGLTHVFFKRRRFASFFSSRSKRIKTTREVAEQRDPANLLH